MIKKITLKNFRKFSNLSIEVDNKIVILAGPNAVGKTSILEAIYLTSSSKSHRTNDYIDLIKKDSDFGVVELKEKKEFKIVISKNGKTYFIDEKNYTKLSDFIGNINVIMFSPMDIELISGSKAVRRHFLDLEISLLDKGYLRTISLYKRILKERNEALKQYSKENQVMLNIITKQLIEQINIIYQKRIQFINEINRNLDIVTKKLNCEKIEIKYVSSYDISNIEGSFNNKLNYDILSKTTNIGVHRDDFLIFIDNYDAKIYASEGQSRNIGLAIKLALMEFYKKKKLDVILLLDDVFASIDQKRINSIMEYVKKEHQTFITTTSLFNIPDELLKDAKIIRF